MKFSKYEILGKRKIMKTVPADRNHTDSRRIEPSSRSALLDEQSNPWDRVQPQDAKSRHRGAKPSRRLLL